MSRAALASVARLRLGGSVLSNGNAAAALFRSQTASFVTPAGGLQRRTLLKWFSTASPFKSNETDKEKVGATAVPPTAEDESEPSGERATEGDAPPPDERDKALAETQAQVADFKDKYMRALAEAENTRRIGVERVEDAKKYAVQGFAKDMLEVADVLHMAIDNVPEEARHDKNNKHLVDLYEGLTSTIAILDKLFKRHKIEPIDPLGHKFDPNLHEAVFQLPDAEREPGTVGAVVKRGYALNGRTIRAATVGVVKKA